MLNAIKDFLVPRFKLAFDLRATLADGRVVDGTFYCETRGGTTITQDELLGSINQALYLKGMPQATSLQLLRPMRQVQVS